MIDNFLALTALRARLKALVVATTGATDLAATAAGFSRSSGSFIVDGFTAGMEVEPTGFADNSPGLIERVTEQVLYIENGRTAEASSSGRRLTVGLPSLRGWENMKFNPKDRRWFIEEDYLPGPPGYQATLGSVGELHVEPIYVIRLYGIAGEGVRAIYTVGDAILRLFRPKSVLSLGNGDALRVRNDIIPSRGQVMAASPSHAVTVITISLWARTLNNGD